MEGALLHRAAMCDCMKGHAATRRHPARHGKSIENSADGLSTPPTDDTTPPPGTGAVATTTTPYSPATPNTQALVRAPTPKLVGTLVRQNDVGALFAAGGFQSVDLKSKSQLASLEATGLGHYYGATSGFHSMTPEDQQKFIAEHLKPGATAPQMHLASCISWAFDNVGAAYRAAGKADRWKEIISIVGPKGSKGTDLAKELKKDGWEAVFWSPDPKNPVDGLSEHTFAALQVAKGKGYYGIPIDHVVENYSPTMNGPTKLDLAAYQELQQVAFFFGVVRGGYHTYVGRYGKISEVHEDENPDSPNIIDETSMLNTQRWVWNSGMVMIPPGTWPDSRSDKPTG